MTDLPLAFRYITQSLTDYIDFTRLDEAEYTRNRGVQVSSFRDYKLVKYDRNRIASDNVATLGLWRSVIIRNGKIVCVAPPKATSLSSFMRTYSASDGKIQLEEFVEGTMINVFWDGDDWEMASRSLIGANGFYYKNSPTFRKMFLEANSRNIEFTLLDKRLIYSFVVCHPCNRLVAPLKTPHLYLVEVLSVLPDGRVGSVDMEATENGAVLEYVKTKALTPKRYPFPEEIEPEDAEYYASSASSRPSPSPPAPNSYEAIQYRYASNKTPFYQMGVILRGGENGERTKMRNPVYAFVSALRNNSHKLLYQYIHLRVTDRLGAFLRFYPEYMSEFRGFQLQIHDFTARMHETYMNVFVKRSLAFDEVDKSLKPHLSALNKIYLDSLQDTKRVITKKEVIQYVNRLEPARLMYALTHN